MSIVSTRIKHVFLASTAIAMLSACNGPLDMDLRGNFGGAFNTVNAAQAATAARPKPDSRGIISYPTYQVAVAQRGDTLQSLATRIGADAPTLASFNGMKVNDPLRKGEVIALRSRVAEPSPETGAVATGPILPPETVDITALAGSAIENAGDQRVETTTLETAPTPAAKPTRGPKPQTGREPIRHQVTRGETAFTISRLYNVSVRSLSEWNGLDSDFAIREGQQLLIPVAAETPPKRSRTPAPATTAPGNGTPTPAPPSSTTALPNEATLPAAEAAAQPQPPAPNVGTTSAAPNRAKMGYPVAGKIIREYVSGKTDGIDISSTAGTPVLAAKNGTVAAITSDADQVPILVIKHAGNLLTVYSNIDGVLVAKGDRVKRGQAIAKVRPAPSSYVHFEVRKGFESVDPLPFLQ